LTDYRAELFLLTDLCSQILFDRGHVLVESAQGRLHLQIFAVGVVRVEDVVAGRVDRAG
jgi:hypothetical protein